jgi:hypothetical protein
MVNQSLTGNLLSRATLAVRWECSIETLKRREKAGILCPVILGRIVRYRLIDIVALETDGMARIKKS